MKVFMAGFESDTFRLQRQGWQISAEESISRYTLRIAIKHPQLKLYGLSSEIDHRMMERDLGARSSGLEVEIGHLSGGIDVITHVGGMPPMAEFNPVDAEPRILFAEPKSIDDFKIFRPLAKEKEIIVPRESVSELLLRINMLQDPKQAEIREKKQKEFRKFNREVNEYNLATDIVAQIAVNV